MRFFKHPKTGIEDPMMTMSVVACSVCLLKFLLDGLGGSVGGLSLSFGHVDPLAYGSLLAPILGAHGYISTRDSDKGDKNGQN